MKKNAELLIAYGFVLILLVAVLTLLFSNRNNQEWSETTWNILVGIEEPRFILPLNSELNQNQIWDKWGSPIDSQFCKFGVELQQNKTLKTIVSNPVSTINNCGLPSPEMKLMINQKGYLLVSSQRVKIADISNLVFDRLQQNNELKLAFYWDISAPLDSIQETVLGAVDGVLLAYQKLSREKFGMELTHLEEEELYLLKKDLNVKFFIGDPSPKPNPPEWEVLERLQSTHAKLSVMQKVWGNRISLVGDFNGDGKADTLIEKYINGITGKETNKHYSGISYDSTVQLAVAKQPITRLEFKNSKLNELQFKHSQSFGILTAQNLGDINKDGADELGLIFDYADWSNVNSIKIFSFQNSEWKQVYNFPIRESDLHRKDSTLKLLTDFIWKSDLGFFWVKTYNDMFEPITKRIYN